MIIIKHYKCLKCKEKAHEYKGLKGRVFANAKTPIRCSHGGQHIFESVGHKKKKHY